MAAIAGVFSPEQLRLMHVGLAQLVHDLRGRKLEEGDWKSIYCRVKGIPDSGWSNQAFKDIVHEGLGVEQKLLGTGGRRPSDFCDNSRMHPAATRSIRIDTSASAESQKVAVFTQYGELIENFRRDVAKTSHNGTVDVRTGWLLYDQEYSQFLYFEETLVAPDPNRFTAEWRENEAKGRRKASKNLWIYDKATNVKRYSVTTEAGAKIQPYFDIPPRTDPGLYVFDIFGLRAVVDGKERVTIWGLNETYIRVVAELKKKGFDNLDDFLLKVDPNRLSRVDESNEEPTVRSFHLSPEAYGRFEMIGGSTDEERLLKILRLI